MAEITEVGEGEAPLQFNVEDTGDSGFGECTVKSKMMVRIKIPPASIKKPTIYYVHWQDPKVTVGEDKILEQTKDAKAWYPLHAACEIANMQMNQVDNVNGTEIGKDVKDITMLIYEPGNNRNHVIPTYSLCGVTETGTGIKGNEYERYKYCRDQSENNLFTEDVLAKVEYESLIGGRYVQDKATNKDELQFVDCHWWLQSKEWIQFFNKPEAQQWRSEFHSSVRLLRPMSELWDPVKQLIKYYVQKPHQTKVEGNKDYVTYPHKVTWKTAYARAYVVYPLDYADGVLTHSNAEIDGSQENFDPAEDPKTKYRIGDEGFYTHTSSAGPETHYAINPINNFCDRQNEMFQYVPSNSENARSQQPWDMTHRKDWAHLIDHKDLYTQDDWTNPEDFPNRTRTKRWWYKEQPFSSEKSMRPIMFMFHNKYTGANPREIYAEFEINFEYTFGTYHLNNQIKPSDIAKMNNRKYTSVNRDMYGTAYRRKVKMADPTRPSATASGKFNSKYFNSGYHRMFQRKPQVHYNRCYLGTESLMDEVEEPPEKIIKL